LNRVLVLNSKELRSGLLKVYRCISLGLTEAEWRAIMGARRQLESAAVRQCNDLLRDALEGSGLPRPLQWVVEKRLKDRVFTDAELETAIKAARDCGAGAAQQEGKTEPQTTK
jgi:hypothetical protein